MIYFLVPKIIFIKEYFYAWKRMGIHKSRLIVSCTLQRIFLFLSLKPFSGLFKVETFLKEIK